MNDLVVEKINEGIGESPNVGFEDIRNLDISSPGDVHLNFRLDAMTQPPAVAAVAFTVATATNIFTVSSTSGWFNGMAITLNSVVTSTGISTGRVYWVGDLSGVTFKLYTNPALAAANLVDVTGSDGSGTISTYTMTAPLDKAIFYIGVGAVIRPYIFILDDSGKVWWIKNNGGSLTSNLVYLGNDTLTGTTGRAIAIHSQDIVVFRTGFIDRLNASDLEGETDLDAAGGWEYGVETISTVSPARRAVLVGQDGILYYDNNNRVGSLTDAYVENTSALDLPRGEDILSLAELGTWLLVGTTRNLIYPWDRVSDSFQLPIDIPENKIARIVSANQLAYVFAGNRGNIYVTNGSSAKLYKKVPDHVTGVDEPYFTWADALIWRNQLYFSFTSYTNAGAALTTAGGVWAIDLNNNALRYSHQPSYASYAGTVTVLLPHILSDTPPGNALYVGWSNTTFGVDVSSTSYYTSYAGYFITPLYQIGTFLNRQSIQQALVMFTKVLASNEGAKLYSRPTRSASWSTAVTLDFATYAAVAHQVVDFPATDLSTVQFKVELTGTTTTPVLREVRLQ